MTSPGSILIVGASAAGLSTAEALRRHGYQGRLTFLDAEPHLPYDRPPLSKQLLSGAWEPPRVQLRGQAQLDALHAEFVLGEPAVALDPAERAVTTVSGRVLRGDVVVIATGLTPLRLPGQDHLEGVHVLRALDDALALRHALSAGTRLVVVGEGVLGAEIAATARTLNLEVTLAGMGGTLLNDQLGQVIGAMLAEKHAERGVRLRLGVAIEELTGAAGRVTGVRPASGEFLPADMVVVAIGSRPATGWLEGSGLPWATVWSATRDAVPPRGCTPSATWPPSSTKGSAGGCVWRTAPTPPSRRRWWRPTSSAPTARTRRSLTSGPTSTTSRSRRTACRRRRPR
ncbi:NAD(P)/FAD-dependent oxidoreductase [Thermocatellispora tengchongensis]|uniref:NAD(P)/FAD-dependent oxidoreductase n=1 Tax=Thermocatellispora tengchongensis TaxID=1073253 RepID=UPI0036282DBD